MRRMRAAREGRGFYPQRPLHRAAEGLLRRRQPLRRPARAQHASPRPRPATARCALSFLLLPAPRTRPDPRAFAQPSACALGQPCPTLCDPVDCSPPGPSVHGILQARTPEGLPCPPPADLPHAGIGLRLLCRPHWQVNSFPLAPPGKPSQSRGHSGSSENSVSPVVSKGEGKIAFICETVSLECG